LAVEGFTGRLKLTPKIVDDLQTQLMRITQLQLPPDWDSESE